jgi:5'-3' exonuclease
MKNLYLIDGTNCAFRAFMAFKELALDGTPVGALYGVVKILSNFVKEFPPGKLIIPFDVQRSSYRLAIYPEYKAHRDKDSKMEKMKEDFHSQLSAIYSTLEEMGICCITEESRGAEADDVISYLIHRFKRGDFDKAYEMCLILSSDKDLCTLVGDNVNWYDPINRLLVTKANFVDTFHVSIEQFADYKSLKGDASDNIPHPPGIGSATAAKLLQEYGSIDKLLEAKHARIEPHKEVLELGRKLVALNLHEIMPEYSIWKRVDAKIKQKMSVDENLYETLAALSFNPILEEWNGILPRLREYAACEL